MYTEYYIVLISGLYWFQMGLLGEESLYLKSNHSYIFLLCSKCESKLRHLSHKMGNPSSWFEKPFGNRRTRSWHTCNFS